MVNIRTTMFDIQKPSVKPTECNYIIFLVTPTTHPVITHVIETHCSYCGVGTEFVYLIQNVLSLTTADHKDSEFLLSQD
jgi:hypothetical protein